MGAHSQPLAAVQVLGPLQTFQQEHPATRVLLQPSAADAHNLPVHPQPPFAAAPGVDMLPAPARMELAGTRVAAAASGVVMDLSGNEVARTVRFETLCQDIGCLCHPAHRLTPRAAVDAAHVL